MKLSKAQIKAQQECEDLLKKERLTEDEKLFVYENWNEGATNINSTAGAFFTPVGLAKDFSICIPENSEVIDLCAGIGMLSFFAHHWRGCNVTCVELNDDYVRVGKKLLPEANWINASIMSDEVLQLKNKFRVAISNPPFGKIKTGVESFEGQKYMGSDFEFKAMDIASNLADYGLFIIPQGSTNFKYSGQTNYSQMSDLEVQTKVKKFLKETGFEFGSPVGIDTDIYRKEWKGVTPLCEIVDIEF